jgi:hypothetical protein
MSQQMDPKAFWEHMDEYAQAFGWIAMHWARLEQGLSMLIGKLAGTDLATAEIIALPLNAFSKYQLVQALARQNLAEGPLRDKVLELIDRFDKLRVRRNAFVHSAVDFVDPADGLMLQRRDKQRGELVKDVAKVPLREVRELGKSLNGLWNELGHICFHHDFAAAFATIRSKPSGF